MKKMTEILANLNDQGAAHVDARHGEGGLGGAEVEDAVVSHAGAEEARTAAVPDPQHAPSAGLLRHARRAQIATLALGELAALAQRQVALDVRGVGLYALFSA